MNIDGQLLYQGYEFSDTLKLDLYGYASEEDGFEVTTAAPSGTKINLADLLSAKQLADMGHWLDRNVKRDRANERLERAMCDFPLMVRDRRSWRAA